jgi:tetratricopeptide (TPR) repeat protein
LSVDGDDWNVFVGTKENPSPFDMIDICGKWHNSQPLLTEPIYYLACSHLQKGNIESFLNYADLYLHQERSRRVSYYMIMYYTAMVYCYQKKDFKKSLEHLLPCLVKQPTMAEFWCLVGDAYYTASDYDRAVGMYENAIHLGSRRKSNSEWPMHISKYREYPEKMIKSCLDLKTKVKGYRHSESQKT